jgi:hypothetical protein
VKEQFTSIALTITASNLPEAAREALGRRSVSAAAGALPAEVAANPPLPAAQPSVSAGSGAGSDDEEDAASVSVSIAPQRSGGAGGGAESRGALRVLKTAAFAYATARATLAATTTVEWVRHDRVLAAMAAARSGGGAGAGAGGGAPARFAPPLPPPRALASRLESVLDLSDAPLIRAAGALLSFLWSLRVITDAPPELASSGGGGAGGGGGVVGGGGGALAGGAADGSGAASAAAAIVLPGSIRLLSLGDFCVVDGATMTALGVFEPPNGGRGGGGGGGGGGAGGARGANSANAASASRGGLSLFSLVDRAVSPAGRRTLRGWLGRPSLSPIVVRARHDAVAFLLAARTRAPEL